MQDYADLPPRGFPPLVGEGAWPDSVVDSVFFLLLILAVVLCFVCYRAGRRMERQRQEYDLGRSPEIIYLAVRRQIDVALLATGERAFGPVRTLIETLDAYLGPVLRLTDGPASLAVVIQKLKKALATDKKKVPVEPEKADHGHAHALGSGSTVIIATGPALGAPSPGVVASAEGAASSVGVAAAAAVGPGGGVQVVQPARVFEIPGHDPHPPHHPPAKPAEKEVELSSRERALAVREALEGLSDYWQKERVEGELRAAQKALTITRAIGDKGLLPRPTRPAPPPPANTVAAKPGGRGFLGILGL